MAAASVAVKMPPRIPTTMMIGSSMTGIAFQKPVRIWPTLCGSDLG